MQFINSLYFQRPDADPTHFVLLWAYGRHLLSLDDRPVEGHAPMSISVNNVIMMNNQKRMERKHHNWNGASMVLLGVLEI